MGIIEELLDAQIISAGEVPGIITGLVKENWDEDHPGMVRVEYFLGEVGKNLTGWVPVAVPYAGNQYGYYARPRWGRKWCWRFRWEIAIHLLYWAVSGTGRIPCRGRQPTKTIL